MIPGQVAGAGSQLYRRATGLEGLLQQVNYPGRCLKAPAQASLGPAKTAGAIIQIHDGGPAEVLGESGVDL